MPVSLLVGSESGSGVAVLALGPTCRGKGDRTAVEILELLILSPLSGWGLRPLQAQTEDWNLKGNHLVLRQLSQMSEKQSAMCVTCFMEIVTCPAECAGFIGLEAGEIITSEEVGTNALPPGTHFFCSTSWHLALPRHYVTSRSPPAPQQPPGRQPGGPLCRVIITRALLGCCGRLHERRPGLDVPMRGSWGSGPERTLLE